MGNFIAFQGNYVNRGFTQNSIGYDRSGSLYFIVLDGVRGQVVQINPTTLETGSSEIFTNQIPSENTKMGYSMARPLSGVDGNGFEFYNNFVEYFVNYNKRVNKFKSELFGTTTGDVEVTIGSNGDGTTLVSCMELDKYDNAYVGYRDLGGAMMFWYGSSVDAGAGTEVNSGMHAGTVGETAYDYVNNKILYWNANDLAIFDIAGSSFTHQDNIIPSGTINDICVTPDGTYHIFVATGGKATHYTMATPYTIATATAFYSHSYCYTIEAKVDRAGHIVAVVCDTGSGLWYSEDSDSDFTFIKAPITNCTYVRTSTLVVPKWQADSGSGIIETDRQIIAYSQNNVDTDFYYYEYIDDIVSGSTTPTGSTPTGSASSSVAEATSYFVPMTIAVANEVSVKQNTAPLYRPEITNEYKSIGKQQMIRRYPTSFVPVPTFQDYQNGWIMRYFMKQKPNKDSIIIEVNENEYNKFYKESLIGFSPYTFVKLRWKISGDILDIQNSNLAVIATNEIVMKGLTKKLTNLVQFWKK